MDTRKHRKAADLWPPAGPAAMPWDARPVCSWCGGRYVPGYWPWHAAIGHRSGPYTQTPAALDRWMQARGLVMP